MMHVLAWQVWKTVQGFNFRHGETHTDPFHPFDHPLAEWRYYSPSNREGYFGQVWTPVLAAHLKSAHCAKLSACTPGTGTCQGSIACVTWPASLPRVAPKELCHRHVKRCGGVMLQVLVYNECLMRSRYSYDYVMLLDVDEFIYLNATTMGRKVPVSLPSFLRHTFPRKTATLEFVTYGYPKNCPASTVSAFTERHKLRDRDIIKHHVKLMVRPKHVQEVFVHFVIAVDEGWQEKLRVKEEAAFLKHIVWYPPFYTNCRAYVYEDTGLGPGE